jgi:imidazolonepropionase-like amidohydrolase
MIALLAGIALAAATGSTCTVLTGAAQVYAPDGPKTGWNVVISGSEIAAVGPGVGAAGDWLGKRCAVVDAKGAVLTAGLIEAHGQIGLVEVDLESSTQDVDAGGDPVRAALRVTDAYDPESAVIPVQRIAGVTGEITHPSGGLVAGQAGFVQLSGETQADTVVAPSVGMDAALRQSPSRAQDVLALRELLDDARVYRTNKAAYEHNQTRQFAASRLDLEALGPVLDRKIPLVIGADREADVEALLRLAKDEGIRLIIEGGAEAWKIAPQIAAAKVPVVVNPMVYGPGSSDQLSGRPDNAKLLAAAGVEVVIATWDTHNSRDLRQYAGNAVRAGMPHDDAVRAITQAPADAYGLADRGRVAAGMSADLVLWNGDPLELSTTAQAVWIAGQAVPMVSRQTELREKYRKLPGTPLEPLELPR